MAIGHSCSARYIAAVVSQITNRDLASIERFKLNRVPREVIHGSSLVQFLFSVHCLSRCNDVYVIYDCESQCLALTTSIAGVGGGELISDIISTRVPQEVAHPHGSNPFAMDDGKATEDPGFAKRASVDVEAIGERTNSMVEREMYPIPTEEEARTLRKISDSIPRTAYMLCLVEFAERASYYGVQVSGS